MNIKQLKKKLDEIEARLDKLDADLAPLREPSTFTVTAGGVSGVIVDIDEGEDNG